EAARRHQKLVRGAADEADKGIGSIADRNQAAVSSKATRSKSAPRRNRRVRRNRRSGPESSERRMRPGLKVRGGVRIVAFSSGVGPITMAGTGGTSASSGVRARSDRE